MLKNIDDYGGDIQIIGDTLKVDLWYPPREPESGKVQFVEVDLMDVRAADGLRISYDFSRDGWVIWQAQVFEWEVDDAICDPQWVEVGFVQAWGSRKHISTEEV